MAKTIVITDPVKIRRFMLIFGLVFIVGGIAALVLGIWSGLGTKEKNDKCTATTAATVTEYETYTSYRRKKTGTHSHKVDTNYSLVYEFEVGGETYVGCDRDVGSNQKPYPVGTKIKIHYDPKDPENSYFYDTSNIKMYAGIGMGVLFMIIGALLASGKLGRNGS
ncbi:MAG: DUF3592 domain-containing protein [Ruminococcus sp.]|nr:DUF3592 domain-containing protein [Ruminococcus sp.]